MTTYKIKPAVDLELVAVCSWPTAAFVKDRVRPFRVIQVFQIDGMHCYKQPFNIENQLPFLAGG